MEVTFTRTSGDSYATEVIRGITSAGGNLYAVGGAGLVLRQVRSSDEPAPDEVSGRR